MELRSERYIDGNHPVVVLVEPCKLHVYVSQPSAAALQNKYIIVPPVVHDNGFSSDFRDAV